jgi:5,10-methylenetetrahydromethanopterin reductase
MAGHRFSAGAWLFPDSSVERLTAICQVLDEAGFEYVWVGDEGLNRDCYVALAAILLATKRLKAGTGITNPFNRNPAVSAAATATLDELSGGRAFVGFGAGGSLNLSPMGLAWRHPLRAVREAIQVSRLLFSGGQVDFAGELYQLHAARLAYARPDIEIHLAGRGAKVLELGGELADGVLLSGKPKFDLEPTMRHINAGAARSGNRPKVFYVAHACFDAASLERSRATHTYMIRNSPAHVKERIGFTPDVEARLAAATEAGSYRDAAALITDAMLNEFVYSGDKAAVARQIGEAMARHQMDVFVANVDSSLDLATVREIAEVVQLAVSS